MRNSFLTYQQGIVTPYAGVWIEIGMDASARVNAASLPTRECGLKLVQKIHPNTVLVVTPYAGVWIEIVNAEELNDLFESLPTRECGLKWRKT